jgi:GNAT superfamily N-acetyltransferase
VDAPDAFGVTLVEEERTTEATWRARLDAEDAATFLAVAEGRDVGLVVGAPYRGLAGALGLFAMWVEPGVRGRGLGVILVEALLAWARERGHTRVVLDVADQNAPAVALYSRMGFEPTGETGVLSPDRPHVTEHRRALVLR